MSKIIIEDRGVTQAPFNVEDGVEIIVREYHGKKVYCIFNFLKREVSIDLDRELTDIINDTKVNQSIKVEPKGYVFLMDSSLR